MIRISAICAFLIMLSLIVALPPTAVAQANPLPVSSQIPSPLYRNPIVCLSPVSIGNFDTVLPIIAEQAKVAFVCEGQPWQPSLSPKEMDQLSHYINPVGMPLEEAVKQIGAAYDYDVFRLSADTFVLTKRYSDKNDLPEVTFEEVTAAFQNILDATQNYRPPLLPTNTLLEIIKTVSPVQLAQMAQGVPVSQMPSDMQTMARQFACGEEFHDLRGLTRIAQRINACKRRDTIFCYRNCLDYKFTAYEGLFGAYGGTDYFALSNWVDTTSGGGTSFDEMKGVKIDVGANKITIQPGVVDPTTPPGPPAPRTADSKFRISLSALAKRMNDRQAVSGTIGLKVRIDPAIARKTVCLVGDASPSSTDLIQSVCDIYGLESRQDHMADTLTIAMPRPNILTDTRQIYTEIDRLLPGAFLRAVRNSGAPVAGDRYSVERASAMYITSTRRLRGIVEPLLNKSVKQQLPLPDASNEARDLVALSSLSKCVADYTLQSLNVSASPFIDHFDQVVFTLSQDVHNPNTYKFKFSYKDEQGKTSASRGGISYPPGTFNNGLSLPSSQTNP